MPWICKWRHNFFVIKLQMVPEFIMTYIFCFKILAIIQYNLLLFVNFFKLYFFHFFLMEMVMEIIESKV